MLSKDTQYIWNFTLIKKIILKILLFTHSLIDFLIQKLECEKLNIKHFKPLSPLDEAEGVTEYLNALKWALDNKKKIKNIAVTGPYGSGKSSVLQTFQKKHEYDKDLKFLNISLATFKDGDREKNTDFKVRENEMLRLIELSVLQQIFYHEVDSKVPDSRFVKIEKRSRLKSLIGACLIFFSTIAYLYIFKRSFFERYFSFSIEWGIIFEFFCYSILLFSTIGLLYKLIFLIEGLVVRKIGLMSATLEISEQVSKSIFNNHLDEILYFFEMTPYNVVIIEDLDRFDQTEVFTKLREINLLLNNSNKINKEIVFIYAIRDEVFANKDRAKFFDFIVPIIPVINISNSSDKLSQIINENKYKISPELIDGVSLFIDDMRLLYNIMNEFYIYSKKINKNIDHSKLLAIIIYKNLDPRDFTNLSKGIGYLHQAIFKKNDLIKKEVEFLNEQIATTYIEIKKNEESNISSLEELRAIYLNKIIAKITNSGHPFHSFFIHQKVSYIQDLMAEEMFNLIIDDLKNTQYLYAPSTSHRLNVGFEFREVERDVCIDCTYFDRASLIKQQSREKNSEKVNKITKLEKRKESIKKLKLKDLIANGDLGLDDFSLESKHRDMIFVLLSQGFIDEDYFDYLSIFHEGNLAKGDYDFLICLKTQKQMPFEYRLEKVDNLVKKISKHDFETVGVLNYTLLDYILNLDDYHWEIERMIVTLEASAENSIDFINGFLEISPQSGKFINFLCKHWDNFFGFIWDHSRLDQAEKESYLVLIINYISPEDIYRVFNYKQSVLAELENLLILPFDRAKILLTIEKLSLKIKHLNENSDMDLVGKVFENKSYQINVRNLIFLMSRFKQFRMENFYISNYQCLLESGDNLLVNYIEENFNEYISNVYLKIETNVNESEEKIISILNNEKVELTLREKVLLQSSVIIAEASSIKNIKILEKALSLNLLFPSWVNVMDVYLRSDSAISISLVRYLNIQNVATELSKKTIDSSYPDKETADLFVEKILLENNLEVEQYRILLKSIPFVDYESLDFNKLDKEKVKCLIHNKILAVNVENYNHLKELFFDLRLDLISINRGASLNLIHTEIGIVDIVELLKLKNIEISYLEDLINKKENEVRNSIEALNAIALWAVQNKKIKINEELLKFIILTNRIDVQGQIEIFLNSQSLFSDEECWEFIKKLPEPYYSISEKGRMPKIDNTQINENWVNLLRERKLISSFRKLNFENKIHIATFKK